MTEIFIVFDVGARRRILNAGKHTRPKARRLEAALEAGPGFARVSRRGDVLDVRADRS